VCLGTSTYFPYESMKINSGEENANAVRITHMGLVSDSARCIFAYPLCVDRQVSELMSPKANMRPGERQLILVLL
jgi:hypothetical protein